MQRLWKGLLLILFLTISLVVAINVNAAGGSATVNLNGPSNVNVSSNFKLMVNLSSITGASDGIGSMDAVLEYDATYLEYVASTSKSVVALTVNDVGNKLRASGFASSNGASGTNIDMWEIEFKALTAGSTTVKLNGIVLGDGNMNVLTHSPSTLNKTITIGSTTTTTTTAPSGGTTSTTTTSSSSKSSNANLSALSISGYTLTESFDKDRTSYTLTVPNNVSSVTVNATAADSKASVSGTGSKSLSVGSNTLDVVVTAENGSKKTYTITVTKAAANASSNNDLKALSVDGYTISPVFDKDTTTYTLTVPHNAEEIIIKADKDDSTASVSGTGTKTVSAGNNQYNIIVTAANGSKKTYTINVTKEASSNEANKSSDATLKSLSIDGHTISPSFNKNTPNYTITVPDSVKDLVVNAVPNDAKAKVEVIGNTNMSAGTNNVMIKVSAEDGTDKYYIVTVKRTGDNTVSGKSANNYLSSIDIKNYPISYNKNTNSYSITVPYEVDKLNITALAENPNSIVSVKGNSNFKVGEVNTVEVSVTAEDGSLRIYTINVYRSPVASKNKLEELEVPGYDLSPKFDPDIEEYELTVKNSVEDLELFFKTQNPNSKVEVIGDKDLKVGHNLVQVKVTDANGFTRIYTIDVEREAPFKILGMNPWLFGTFAALLLGGLFWFFILGKRRKKEEPVKEVPVVAPAPVEKTVITDTQPTINFSPIINIGSQNDSEISGNDLKKENYNNTNAKEPPKEIEPDYIIGDTRETLEYHEPVKQRNDIDELMQALKNEDINKLNMFRRQVEADEIKDELRGRDPERNDDLFDEEVTVREVIKAIDNYEKTGNSKPIELLIKQYEANKYRNSYEYKSRFDRYHSE